MSIGANDYWSFLENDNWLPDIGLSKGVALKKRPQWFNLKNYERLRICDPAICLEQLFARRALLYLVSQSPNERQFVVRASRLLPLTRDNPIVSINDVNDQIILGGVPLLKLKEQSTKIRNLSKPVAMISLVSLVELLSRLERHELKIFLDIMRDYADDQNKEIATARVLQSLNAFAELPTPDDPDRLYLQVNTGSALLDQEEQFARICKSYGVKDKLKSRKRLPDIKARLRRNRTLEILDLKIWSIENHFNLSASAIADLVFPDGSRSSKNILETQIPVAIQAISLAELTERVENALT